MYSSSTAKITSERGTRYAACIGGLLCVIGSHIDEEKIEVVANGDSKQITHGYSVLVEQEKIKETVEKLITNATIENVLYEYCPISSDGETYYYVKLVLKIKEENVESFITNNIDKLDISSSYIKTVDVETSNVGFEKIDIEINAGSSKGSSDTSSIIIYVFLGLIVAVIIGSSIYKFVKARKAMKKQQEQSQEENQDNNSENKGGDFFS